MSPALTARAGLLLRRAGPEDASALATVFARAVLTRARGAYGPRELAAWAEQGSAERFAAMLADPAKTVLAAVGAEPAAELVGLAGLEGEEIILLYADPAAPPGTGRTLLGAVERLARQRGIEAVRLFASRNAVPFYLARGYAWLAMAGRELPGGQRLPGCLMAKTLANGDAPAGAPADGRVGA